MIKYFTIYGERCTGTNFLEQAIVENFELELIWHYHYKHFFGFYDFSKKNPIIQDDNEVLFLALVRDPVYWINSLYQKKHHIPEQNTNNIKSFINNEFYSVNEENQEIMEDRHLKTKKRYKNIFELRNIKNNYLIHELQEKVKNYLLIRYEDLNNYYETVMMFLDKKFQLKRKHKDWVKINSYKGQKNKLFIQNQVQIPIDIIKKIKLRINQEQEKSIGYL